MGVHDLPEYGVWCEMKARCHKPTHKAYKNYGGRGIVLSERWHLFSNFLSDMGRRPTPKHTIERVENDGNYELSNCVWATRKDQVMNRRNTITIEVDGVKIGLQDVADKFGVRYQTIIGRYNRGWSPERILNCSIEKDTPEEIRKIILESSLSNSELSRMYDVSDSTVSGIRIRAGLRQRNKKTLNP